MGIKTPGEQHNAKVVPLVPLFANANGPESAQPELDLGIPAAPKTAPESQPGTDHPDGGKLPRWIHQQLQANRTRTKTKRKAEFHHCKTCNEIVITGLDEDMGAILATIDPTPLSQQQEAAALIANRKTYNARIEAAGYITIARRDRYHMRRGDPVTPAHQCGARFPGFITKPATPVGETNSDDNEPPF